MSTSTTPTFITEVAPPYYLTTAVLNDCYSEVTAYTMLADTYWASFHDAYECYIMPTNDTDYSCHIKTHKTYLTNRMGSISHQITLLVINSLGGGHTHTHAYRRSRTEVILRNQARAGLWPAHAWFN